MRFIHYKTQEVLSNAISDVLQAAYDEDEARNICAEKKKEYETAADNLAEAESTTARFRVRFNILMEKAQELKDGEVLKDSALDKPSSQSDTPQSEAQEDPAPIEPSTAQHVPPLAS